MIRIQREAIFFSPYTNAGLHKTESTRDVKKHFAVFEEAIHRVSLRAPLTPRRNTKL